MKPILIFLLKVIATIPALLELWLRFIIAAMFWDDRFLTSPDSLDIIWKSKYKKQ